MMHPLAKELFVLLQPFLVLDEDQAGHTDHGYLDAYTIETSILDFPCIQPSIKIIHFIKNRIVFNLSIGILVCISFVSMRQDFTS